MDYLKSVEWLAKKSNLTKDEILKRVAKEIADLNGLIDESSAILIVAKRLGNVIQDDIPAPSDDMSELPNIWDNLEEKSFIKSEFVNWDVGVNRFRLTKPIREYPVRLINTQFGPAPHIDIEVAVEEDVFDVQTLNLRSVRLKLALLSINPSKYPVIVQITRLGTAFKTNYKAEIIEVVTQTTLPAGPTPTGQFKAKKHQ